MFAKAGLVVIGLGAISIGGVAVAKPHLLGMDYMPEFHSLSKDSDFSSSGYDSGKLGHKFKNYLVGVTNKTSGDNNTSNRAWWEWAFRRLQANNKTAGEKFKYEGKKASDAVTEPYAENDTGENAKALNQVCKKAYKEEDSTGFSETDKTKFKKSDVWKYCSPLGKEPTKVGDNEYSGQVGSESNAGFISVKDGTNDMFWSIREKEVQGKDDNFTKVPSAGIATGHFSDRKLPMKKLCKKAYETQKSSAGATPNPTAEETKKYCKFEISES